MLLPSLLKSGDQVYQKVIKQLYQKMLLLNLLITVQRHTPGTVTQALHEDRIHETRSMAENNHSTGGADK